jgi:hypothetical protein
MGRKANTTSIHVGSIKEICNGVAFSEAQGKHLNIAFTIWLEQLARSSGRDASHILKKFIGNISEWMRAETSEPAYYIYTTENAGRKGLHVHVMMHMPEMPKTLCLNFIRRITKLLPYASTFGDSYTIHFTVDDALKKDLNSSASPADIIDYADQYDEPPIVHDIIRKHPNQRKGILRYQLKGIDPDIQCYLGDNPRRLIDVLELQPKPQGVVDSVPRYGVSRSLGPKARSDAGWTELTKAEDLATVTRFEETKRQRRKKAA